MNITTEIPTRFGIPEVFDVYVDTKNLTADFRINDITLQPVIDHFPDIDYVAIIVFNSGFLDEKYRVRGPQRITAQYISDHLVYGMQRGIWPWACSHHRYLTTYADGHLSVQQITMRATARGMVARRLNLIEMLRG